MPVGELPGGTQRWQQRRRRDQKTEAQQGKQGLGKGSDVDDAARPVDALQRLQRPLGEAEFAVVVVFDDDRAVALRPFQ